ncbi:hypothetical protein TNCV_4959961 [Trichonephila clavipes]|uniref:Uncharacterized protein n=1 Tax=Trichonephila clavipes TaxID=2585209 RepID=A0A8X6SSI5_TRICX|nr:hypothetical protein TNCV_4959961 [Trichonephila clavipes]
MWPWLARSYGYELVGCVSWTRAPVPLKTRRVELLMHVKSIEAPSPPAAFSSSQNEVTTDISFTLTMSGFSYRKGEKGNKRFW